MDILSEIQSEVCNVGFDKLRHIHFDNGSSSDSESDKSVALDERYYQNQPPAHNYESIKTNIVKVSQNSNDSRRNRIDHNKVAKVYTNKTYRRRNEKWGFDAKITRHGRRNFPAESTSSRNHQNYNWAADSSASNTYNGRNTYQVPAFDRSVPGSHYGPIRSNFFPETQASSLASYTDTFTSNLTAANIPDLRKVTITGLPQSRSNANHLEQKHQNVSTPGFSYMSSSSTNAVNPFPPKRDKTSYLMPAIPIRTQSNRSNKSSNNYPQTKNYVSKNPLSMEPTNTTGSSKVSEESLMQDAKLQISPSYYNRQILSADQLLNDHRQRNVVPNQTTRSTDSTRTLDSVKNSTKYPIEGVVRRFSDDFSDLFNDHDIKLAVEDKTSNTHPNTPAKGTGYHIFGRNTIQEVKEQIRPRKNPPTPLARPHGQVMEPSSQTQVNHFEEAFSRYLGSRFAENEIPSEVGKENGNEESADVVEDDEAECMNVAERFKAWFCEVFCCDYAS